MLIGTAARVGHRHQGWRRHSRKIGVISLPTFYQDFDAAARDKVTRAPRATWLS
jgi:hypothetical protein